MAESGGTQYSGVLNMSMNQTIVKTFDLKVGKKYNLNSKNNNQEMDQ